MRMGLGGEWDEQEPPQAFIVRQFEGKRTNGRVKDPPLRENIGVILNERENTITDG